MISEELGVDIKTELSQIIGISEVKILTPNEYKNQTNPKGWFPKKADGIIIQLNLYGDPENFIIKQISDVCYHTNSQIHYSTSEDEVNASTAYICPTTNEFSALYSVLPTPEKESLTV